jgi:hypothetical protein
MRLDLIDPEPSLHQRPRPPQQRLELSECVGPHKVAHVDDVGDGVSGGGGRAATWLWLVRGEKRTGRARGAGGGGGVR